MPTRASKLGTVHLPETADSAEFLLSLPRAIRLLLLVALVGASALATATAQTASGASVTDTGWWNRTDTTDSPLPTVPPGVLPDVDTSPAPGVAAEDALPVGSIGDEPQYRSAINIFPDANDGATVVEFTLTIGEDGDSAASVGAGATVVACPITEFWIGGPDGQWETQPGFDCEAAEVAGERDDDGTWTFDLAPVGELWFDAASGVSANGIMLTPPPSDPGGPTVVFATETIDVVLVATGGDDGGGLFVPPTTNAPPPTSPPTTRAPVTAPPATSGGNVVAPPPTTAPTVAAPASTAPPTTAAEVAAPPAAPETTPVADQTGNLANLPVAVFLLVPVALAVLVATSYWLGPAGNPAAATVSGRGVNRALDASRRKS